MKKTSLVCAECGKPIYSNQGFYTSPVIKHARTCENIMGIDDCRQYNPDRKKKRFVINYVEHAIKRKAGFTYDRDGLK